MTETVPPRPVLPPAQAAALHGAKLTSAGLALADLWRIVHSNTVLVARFSGADSTRGNGSTLRMVEEAERQLRADLASVAAADWAALCSAAGWTLTGAAMLSWCEDADYAMVWESWARVGAPIEADAVYLRAARLVRPDLLPKGLTTSALFGAAQNDYNAVCAAIAANPAAIRLDYRADQLAQAPAFFTAFLAAPQIGLLPAVQAQPAATED